MNEQWKSKAWNIVTKLAEMKWEQLIWKSELETLEIKNVLISLNLEFRST